MFYLLCFLPKTEKSSYVYKSTCWNSEPCCLAFPGVCLFLFTPTEREGTDKPKRMSPKSNLETISLTGVSPWFDWVRGYL